MPAAMASMAAAKQGKFWEYHDKIFANQRALDDADLVGHATAIGLDMGKFNADRKDPKLRRQIENEQKSAVSLGARGTPAFFVNGKYIKGAARYENLKSIVDAEIKAVDALAAKGTKPVGFHKARASANLGRQANIYWGSLIEGKAAPRPRPRVDPTVWKVTVADHNPVKGKADALVTIIEWSDYQ
jgi:hypothetical protein